MLVLVVVVFVAVMVAVAVIVVVGGDSGGSCHRSRHCHLLEMVATRRIVHEALRNISPVSTF